MDDIYKMLEGNKPKTEEKKSNLNNNTTSYRDKVYRGIAFDPDAVNRNTKYFMVHSVEELPDSIKAFIDENLVWLARNKYILRCMADENNKFEDYIFPTYVYKEIYLPWASFNTLITPILKYPTEMAFRIAVWYFLHVRRDSTEDMFNDLPNAVKSFLARNMHIMFGKELNAANKFIIIYSECGTTKLSRDTDFKKLGRLSDTIQMANKLDIKLYNIGDEGSRDELKKIGLILNKEQ